MSFWKKRSARTAATVAATAALSLIGIAGALAAPDTSEDTLPKAASATLTPTSGPAAGGEGAALTGPYDYNMPVFTKVAAAMHGNFGLGVSDEGLLYAWGDNTNGQLGTGDKVASGVPVQVQGLPPEALPIQDVAGAQNMASFAVGADGNVYAWGANRLGLLGNGTTTASLTPVKVNLPQGEKAVQVSASGDLKHSAYALTEAGHVYAWGDGFAGQLGNGSSSSSSTPVQVVGGAQGGEFLTGIKQIHSSVDAVLALTEDGTVYSWGYNFHGDLGIGFKSDDSSKPVRVSMPAAAGPVAKVAGGAHNGFALTEEGKVYGWGVNSGGLMGSGATSEVYTPRLIPGLDTVTVSDITTAFWTATVLTDEGKLLSWGKGIALGNGSSSDSSVPVPVDQTGVLSGVSIKDLGKGGGAEFTLVLGDDGKVYSWGKGALGSSGEPSVTSNVPVLGPNFGFPVFVSWTHLLPSGTRAAAGAQTELVEVTNAQKSGDDLVLSMVVPAGVAGDTADVVGRSWSLLGGSTPGTVNSPDWQVTYHTYLLDEDAVDFDKDSAFTLESSATWDVGANADFTFRVTNKIEGELAVTGLVEGTFTGVNAGGDAVDLQILSCEKVLAGETEGTDLGITPGSSVSFSPAIVLAPNDELVCKAPYTLSQGDIDSGSVVNNAKVTIGYVGLPSGVTFDDVEVSTQEIVSGDPEVSWEFQKSFDPDYEWEAGQNIGYLFSVENKGNATLHDLNIDESAFTGTGSIPVVEGCSVGGADVALPLASLAPAGKLVCQASYTLTQADIDAGVVDNTATLTGTDNVGQVLIASGENALEDSASVSGKATAELSMEKTAEAVQKFVAGESVQYTVTVTNQGNGTASNVTVEDPGPSDGTGTMGIFVCAVGGEGTELPASVAPGQSLVCTAQYTLSQDDVDQGSLSNTATVAGTGPAGPGGVIPDLGGEVGPVVTIPTDQATADLVVVKTGSVRGDSVDGFVVGGFVDYKVTTTNKGNGTAFDVTVQDPGPVGGTGEWTGLTCDSAMPVISLAPGASVECEGTYTLTAADIEAGSVVNVASAEGREPNPGIDPSMGGEPTSGTSGQQTVSRGNPSTPSVVPGGATGSGGLANTGADVKGIAGVAAIAFLAGLALVYRKKSTK